MADLLITKLSETSSTITLGWSPVPCLGYVFYADGKRVSNTWDPTKASVKFAKGAKVYTVTAVGLAATGTYPAVEPPPPPPPSQGTSVSPGQMAAAINAANAGDVLVAVGGPHPKLTLSKSFAAPGLTIQSDGSYFQGIDTNGQSGYTFTSFESRLPVETNNIDTTSFYLHGGSQRINVGAGKLSGGYDGIKVYGGCRDCNVGWGDGELEITDTGGDGIHVNQAFNMTVGVHGKVFIHDLHEPSPEHSDGIHAQTWSGLHLGPLLRLESLVRPGAPRTDVDSAGLFLRNEPPSSPADNLVVEGVHIHWQTGRGMQMLAADGVCVLRDIVITDSGIPGQSPPITLDNETGGTIECYGISEADCDWNSSGGRAATSFH